MSILKNTNTSNMILEQTTSKTKSTATGTTAKRTTNGGGVRFHQLVKVKLTLHINNYTDEEIEACWFTPTEYNSIQKRIFMTLDRMKLSSPTSTNNINLFSNSNSYSSKTSSPSLSSLSSSHCTRGLENLSSSGLKESTRIRRRNAVLAVLNEQDRQQYEMASNLRDSQQQEKNKNTLQHTHNLTQMREIDDTTTTTNMMFLYDDIKIRDASRNYTRISEDIAYTIGRTDHTFSCMGIGVVDNSTSSSIYDDTVENLFQSNHGSEKKWIFNTTSSGHHSGQQQVHDHHQQQQQQQQHRYQNIVLP